MFLSLFACSVHCDFLRKALATVTQFREIRPFFLLVEPIFSSRDGPTTPTPTTPQIPQTPQACVGAGRLLVSSTCRIFCDCTTRHYTVPLVFYFSQYHFRPFYATVILVTLDADILLLHRHNKHSYQRMQDLTGGFLTVGFAPWNFRVFGMISSRPHIFRGSG